MLNKYRPHCFIPLCCHLSSTRQSKGMRNSCTFSFTAFDPRFVSTRGCSSTQAINNNHSHSGLEYFYIIWDCGRHPWILTVIPDLTTPPAGASLPFPKKHLLFFPFSLFLREVANKGRHMLFLWRSRDSCERPDCPSLLLAVFFKVLPPGSLGVVGRLWRPASCFLLQAAAYLLGGAARQHPGVASFHYCCMRWLRGGA